jgi:hypothetical protein
MDEAVGGSSPRWRRVASVADVLFTADRREPDHGLPGTPRRARGSLTEELLRVPAVASRVPSGRAARLAQSRRRALTSALCGVRPPKEMQGSPVPASRRTTRCRVFFTRRRSGHLTPEAPRRAAPGVGDGRRLHAERLGAPTARTTRRPKTS